MGTVSKLFFIFFSNSKRLTDTVFSLATLVFSDFKSFADVLALALAFNSSPCSSLTHLCKSLRVFSIAFRLSTALATSARRFSFSLKINASFSSILFLVLSNLHEKCTIRKERKETWRLATQAKQWKKQVPCSLQTQSSVP